MAARPSYRFACELDDALVCGGKLERGCHVIAGIPGGGYRIGIQRQCPAPRAAFGLGPEAAGVAGAVHAENDFLDLGVVWQSLVRGNVVARGLQRASTPHRQVPAGAAQLEQPGHFQSDGQVGIVELDDGLVQRVGAGHAIARRVSLRDPVGLGEQSEPGEVQRRDGHDGAFGRRGVAQPGLECQVVAELV